MKVMKPLFFGIMVSGISGTAVAEDVLPTVAVYKTEACGCCSQWMEHLQNNGFPVKYKNVDRMSEYKERANVPYGYGACHTAFVSGYAVEGHVPAEDIKRMLAERPVIRGLTVPGMPVGSPGMEYDGQKGGYQTISFTKEGKTEVYASH